MPQLLRDDHGFTTVRDPFASDDHVRAHFRELPYSEHDTGFFKDSVKRYSVLRYILSELKRLNNGAPTPIIDVGVYQGRFTIASYLIAKKHQMPLSLRAVEALEKLISPIEQNFDLYGVEGVTLTCAALSELDGQSLKIGSRRGGLIASTLVAPEEKAGADGEVAIVRSITLASLMRELQDHALVKIDIEGNEAAAFRGAFAERRILENNLFIIEWAPWQCDQKLSGTGTFGEFVLQNFAVYPLGNWACTHAQPLATKLDDLRNCLQDGRSFNTDLLLIPKKLASVFEGLPQI